MTKDLVAKLQKEILSLEGLLRGISTHLSGSLKVHISNKMEKIEHYGTRIGGQTLVDTKQLKQAVDRFLEGELEAFEVHAMLLQALKLEQETREL